MSERIFALARKPTAAKWGLWLALTVLVTVLLWLGVGLSAQSPRLAAGMTVGTAILLWAVFVLFDRSRQVRFVVDDDRLVVRGDPFGRAFPFSSLKLDEAAILNLDENRDLRPKWKLMGTALPGYYAGWFSLRNQRQATVFLSDLQHVLAVPRNDGKWLLLSCVEPAGLLAALQEQKNFPPSRP